jgi:DNA helicase TIP49 (TBP-interacting protein)
MPEQITENATAPAQGQPAAPTGDVVTVSPEAQALLDSLNETADKSFESEEELNQAVSSGQVEAGDVVVVGSSVYLISKGGKAQKIGG